MSRLGWLFTKPQPSKYYILKTVHNSRCCKTLANRRFEDIPRQWKTSLLIPLYTGKGKDNCDPSNYIPVSMIPVFCKIFENVLLNRVATEFQLQHIICPCNQQNGFQGNISCLTTTFNKQKICGLPN